MRLSSLYNPLVIWLLRSRWHRLLSSNTMLITYIGRRSGCVYTTPVNYLRVDDTLWTISRRNRVWWRNLRDGAPVTVCLRGQDVPGIGAVTADNDEAMVVSLKLYLQRAPQRARYVQVALDPEGQPNDADAQRAARERVMVRIQLVADPARISASRPEAT